MFGWPSAVSLALAGHAEDERLATTLDDLLVSRSSSRNASDHDNGRNAARPALAGRDIRPAQGGDCPQADKKNPTAHQRVLQHRDQYMALAWSGAARAVA